MTDNNGQRDYAFVSINGTGRTDSLDIGLGQRGPSLHQ